MNQKKRLMIMGGGSGGHVFPGIAVAHHLMEKGWKILWLGSKKHIEADLVPKYGIEIDFIRITGLRGKGLITLLGSPIQILNACCQARNIMKRFKPTVVLGMGGYVSGPGGLAAWLLGIPIILHEQNGIAGLTNKWLAKIATKVIQAFPGAFSDAKIVGNPIRIDVLTLALPQERLLGRNGEIHVLVIGGSQGARILNQTMPKVAQKLSGAITIWHQSGKGKEQIVKQAYAYMGQTKHKVSEFIDNIADAYAWADVVVCRSGAITVSEIAAAGLPAMFVPFQHKDRQQYWNALPLEKIGAAKILEQSQFTAEKVAATLSGWNRKILLDMAKRARKIAVLDATEQVANEITLLLAKSSSS